MMMTLSPLVYTHYQGEPPEIVTRGRPPSLPFPRRHPPPPPPDHPPPSATSTADEDHDVYEDDDDEDDDEEYQYDVYDSHDDQSSLQPPKKQSGYENPFGNPNLRSNQNLSTRMKQNYFEHICLSVCLSVTRDLCGCTRPYK